jgi:hypothetical protein
MSADVVDSDGLVRGLGVAERSLPRFALMKSFDRMICYVYSNSSCESHDVCFMICSGSSTG